MARIYLSSTFADLQSAREAVYHALRRLGHDVVAMEDYVATDQRPSEKCLEDVRSCDIYLGIFAWRYGYVPAEGGGKSITEMEFREAVKNAKPCLLFLLHEEAAWPKKYIDRNTESIDALRAEIGRDFTVSFFQAEDELATLASTAVTNLLNTIASKPKAPQTQYLRSPWLGIEFWQNNKRCGLTKNVNDNNVLQLMLKPEPFEMHFPTASPDRPVMICGSYNNTIFTQIRPNISTYDVPFYRLGTGMADTTFGSGTLCIREDGHIHLTWERLVQRPEGGGIYMFNAIYEWGEEKILMPIEKTVYIVVYIPTTYIPNAGPNEMFVQYNDYECFALSFGK
jgi:hypothetical protein